MNVPKVKLTSLAHGGGCGCKLAPSVLQQLLADQPAVAPFKQLLVGTETADDAAVWQLDESTCIIATTDFFMPMVDDPFDFGRIAATNAISDVYAMGGKPILALAILGMPVDKIPTEMVREILKGGAAVCAVGRHSGRRRPFHRLPRAGLRPRRDRHLPPGARAPQRRCARPGDALILTKPIGVGIYSAAIKKGALPPRRLHRDDRAPRRCSTASARELAQGRGRARHHRRHRLRPARPRAGDGARLEA